MKSLCILVFSILFLPGFATAQESKDPNAAPNMPGMDKGMSTGMDMSQMPGMKMGPADHMNMQSATFIQEILSHDSSGTSAQPNSTPAPMLMTASARLDADVSRQRFRARRAAIQLRAAATNSFPRTGSWAWRSTTPARAYSRFAPCSGSSPPRLPANATRCSFSRARRPTACPSPTASIRIISSWSWPRSTI